VCFRPEADGLQDAITVQEDELVAAEWQTLAQFEDNPFPKDIPLLGQVGTPWLRLAMLNVSLYDTGADTCGVFQIFKLCMRADCGAVLSVRSRGLPWPEDPQVSCPEQAQRGHTDVCFEQQSALFGAVTIAPTPKLGSGTLDPDHHALDPASLSSHALELHLLAGTRLDAKNNDKFV
jgi:hypothetical protein